MNMINPDSSHPAERITDILNSIKSIEGYEQAKLYDLYASITATFILTLSNIPPGNKKLELMHRVADCINEMKGILKLRQSTCTVIYDAVFKDMLDLSNWIHRNQE